MEQILKTNRPTLSPGSLRTYLSILKNTSKAISAPLESAEDVVTHCAKILESVKDCSANVRKTRLSACVVACEKAKGASKALEAFRECMKEDRKTFNEQQDKQEMTERQKEGMVPYAEVMEKYHKLEAEVIPLMKKDTLTKQDFSRVQLYVLLSCMLLIEPRRSMDWTEFKIRSIDDAKDNYVKVIKRKPTLVFNTYKTARKYGQQMEDCPPALYRIIKRWMDFNPHEWLLMNTRQNGKITSTQLTNILYAFFQKPISSSMLRHIYLTEKYKNIPALADMKKTATAMAHSVEEGLRYVLKSASVAKSC